MKLVGANPAPRLTGVEELPGKVNYLIGNDPHAWHTGIPIYSRVRSAQVYPGVDLVFHGDERQLEYDFIVSPGADPNRMALRITGAKQIELNQSGDLVLHTSSSQVLMHKPVIYQPVGAERRPVEGAFALRANGDVGFQLAAYDRSQPLVIDPKITYATFLGGAGQDQPSGVALDTVSTPGKPKLYVSGVAFGMTTFPEAHTLIGSSGGFAYGFIAKIDPLLTGAASLNYLTFVGGHTPLPGSGSCGTFAAAIGLDTSQGVSLVEPVIGGQTSCSDFPVTTGSPPLGGVVDNFVTRLMPSGAALDTSIFVGGNGQEGGGFLSVDSSGNVLLAAGTTSTNLPATLGAYATKLNNGGAGTRDCFVAKLSRSLVVQYLTYLNVGAGTPNINLGCGAIEDPSTGDILAGGNTFSSTAFQPIGGANGFQTTFAGTEDTFLVKLNPSLNGTSQLVYATYLGGGGKTEVRTGAVLLGSGLVVIAGNTTSGTSTTLPNIPLTPDAFLSSNIAAPTSAKGIGYVFAADTTKTGLASLIYSSYFGGSGGDERVQAIAFDPAIGNSSILRLVLGGQTTSTDFPTMNPLQATLTGAQNGWVSVMNVPTSSAGPKASLAFSTYIGGNFGTGPAGQNETILGLAVDANHKIYAAGRTLSDNFFANTTLATVVNGFQTTCSSCSPTHVSPVDDAVVFALPLPGVTLTPASLTFAGQLLGTTSASKTVTLTNSGGAGPLTISSISASGDYAQTNTCPISPTTLAVGKKCTITVTFTPSVAGKISGEISVSDSAPSGTQLVNLSGTGLIPLTISPASFAFGTVPVGNTSLAQTVTLTNNQSGTTLTFSFSASGNYSAVGSGGIPCVASLAAGASCTMSVTFSPKASGAINGAVTITHNASFTPQEVALSGTGGPGVVGPLTFSPASLTFAAQLVGTTSAGKKVTVTNSSLSSLNITGFTATGNYTAAGSGTTPCAAGALAAGASCTFAVTFSPSLNGTIKGAVVFTDSATVGTQVLNLSGTAALPVSFSPATLTFAAQPVGTTSGAKTVTLTNNQSVLLSINSIVASGEYTVVPGTCGASLAAKGKCTFNVTFSPASAGTIKGVVTITHDAASSPQVMALTGTGQ